MRIGIVGGSISGCAACVALLQLGHGVEVFERAVGALEGRGAGIATLPSVLEGLRERKIIGERLETLPFERNRYFARLGVDDRLGRTLATRPDSLVALNWSDLYLNLRKRVPHEVYHAGRRVVSLEAGEGKRPRLRLEDGAKEDFDLAIFADGYNSLGRRYVSPETKQTYRGYVLWRGAVDRRRLSDGGRVLERSFFRLYYSEGHAGVYLVPPADPKENVSRVNWGCYLPVRDLQAFLVDREGRQHSGSIPPGLMRASQESDLKLWAREALPPYFVDIVEASTDTFAQAIYTADAARYHRNRTCVLGDAGILVQPFTGSGVFKATNDALELAKALNDAEDVYEALERWSAKETELGRRLLSVGERLEQLLIWRVPDFAAMDADSLQRWLDEIRSIQSEAFQRQ